MELNTQQINEQNEISLQTKDTKKKGMEKLKQLHQKNNHGLVLGRFIPRW